ncbi:MAG: RluA family pseudouridine synthase [Christensenellaceae bacterium]|nr:RluA family pseudouridine synthase [Christensenellaceae bacterium]
MSRASVNYLVPPELAGRKLRDILRQEMRVSYGAMKSAKWDGRILLDGVPAAVNSIVREGQVITMRWPDNAPAYALKPYSLPLTIPYEDDHLLVIDKPAPLASQSGAGHPDDSLENALYARFGCPDDFIYRPVNRLDRGTSGLMVVAKNAHAQHRLQEMLHTSDFSRVYLAVTEGIPTPLSGVIDAPIAKEDAASIRRVISEMGKPSLTRYETLQTSDSRALVRLRLETGRTHQIRVHLAHLGCPVCGDFLYGTELPELPGRFALHSAELALLHPFTGEALRLSSPLPQALQSLL